MGTSPLRMSAGAGVGRSVNRAPYLMGVVAMDLTVITQLVSQVGFPIACCVVMFMSLTREQDNHKAEMSAIVEAVNNNTLALTKLSERIERNDN